MIELKSVKPRFAVPVLADFTEVDLREFIGLKQRLAEVATPGEAPEETLDRVIRMSKSASHPLKYVKGI